MCLLGRLPRPRPALEHLRVTKALSRRPSGQSILYSARNAIMIDAALRVDSQELSDARLSLGPTIPRALNTFDLASIHADRCAGHPLRGRRDHKSEKFGDLFWLSGAADPGLFWKLLCRILNTHVVRRCPFLEERAAAPRHHAGHDTVYLNAILNALLCKSFRERCDCSIESITSRLERASLRPLQG